MFRDTARIILMVNMTLAAPLLTLSGQSVPSCQIPPAAGDTARFVGISRGTEPPGTLREWSDGAGRLFYAESWSIASDKYLWDGSIISNLNGPEAYTARRLKNSIIGSTESVERQKDSVVVVRDVKRTSSQLAQGVIPIPGFISAPVRMALLECTFRNRSHSLETSRFGRVHAEIAGRTTLRHGQRSEQISLVLLRTGTDEIAARAWVDKDGRVVAYPFAEGVMDLVRSDWAGMRDRITTAELHAALPHSPNCHSGDGPGGCNPSPRVCNLPSQAASGQSGRIVTISDSGYAIRSDGRGAYVYDSLNVLRGFLGVVTGLELRPPRGTEVPRYFLIDLNHPVPGDLGRPRGVIKVNGSFPGRFVPSGSRAANELLAHANTDWDYQQHSLAEIPVGGSISVEQIDIDFYINDIVHVLQMGPQPYGHCHSSGTAIYGDGTTKGTVSHPDQDHWIIDLPPGSRGRLFENRTGDPNAINRGLYYVSLHFVVQK